MQLDKLCVFVGFEWFYGFLWRELRILIIAKLEILIFPKVNRTVLQCSHSEICVLPWDECDILFDENLEKSSDVLKFDTFALRVIG